MQHDIVLKKFYLLTPRVRVGSVGKIVGTMLLRFVILFNMICHIDRVMKKMIYNLFTSSPGVVEGGL